MFFPVGNVFGLYGISMTPAKRKAVPDTTTGSVDLTSDLLMTGIVPPVTAAQSARRYPLVLLSDFVRPMVALQLNEISQSIVFGEPLDIV
jgi:hypothetical protein